MGLRKRTVAALLVLATCAILYGGSYAHFRVKKVIVHFQTYSGSLHYDRVETVMHEGPEIWIAAGFLATTADDILPCAVRVAEYDARRARNLDLLYWPARKLEELFWRVVD